VAEDVFGHAIDPAVGYARGAILSSSAAEMRRVDHAGQVMRERIARLGPDSLGIFTGNRRDFLLRPDDLPVRAEEWIGSALFAPELDAAIRGHLEAPAAAATAVFNRGSAALVAAILALAEHGRVLSFVPAGDRSHPSVRRGAMLAGAALEECDDPLALHAALAADGVSLLVVTPVTSSLASLTDAALADAIAAGRARRVPVLVDDAYGARLRPVLAGGQAAFRYGADLVVTNADKAGLHGPRAGILAGDAAHVVRIAGRAAELGLEARAPIALGVLRGLQAWAPEDLRREAADGAALAQALTVRLGPLVRRTLLGPLVPAEDVLAEAMRRAGRSNAPLVPIEATAVIGANLLVGHGIVTTNALGRPGSHPALRLKPTAGALARCGGVEAVVAAVDAALDDLAVMLCAPDRVRALLLGNGYSARPTA